MSKSYKKYKVPDAFKERCPRCGLTSTSHDIAVNGSWNRQRKQALAELIRGGIREPCELCEILGLNHAALDQDRVSEIEAEQEYYRLVRPVKCSQCNKWIQAVPCISCTLCGPEKYYVVRRRSNEHRRLHPLRS